MLDYVAPTPDSAKRWVRASWLRVGVNAGIVLIDILFLPHYLPWDVWLFGRYFAISAIIWTLAGFGVIYGIVALRRRARGWAIAAIVANAAWLALATGPLWNHVSEVYGAYRHFGGVMVFANR